MWFLTSASLRTALGGLLTLAIWCAAGNTPALAGPTTQACDSARLNGNAKGLKICRTAAESDNAEAQYFMGLMYAEGDGVERDREAGFQWLKKAALNDYPSARFVIDLLYPGRAHEVKKDPLADLVPENLPAGGVVSSVASSEESDDKLTVDQDQDKRTGADVTTATRQKQAAKTKVPDKKPEPEPEVVSDAPAQVEPAPDKVTAYDNLPEPEVVSDAPAQVEPAPDKVTAYDNLPEPIVIASPVETEDPDEKRQEEDLPAEDPVADPVIIVSDEPEPALPPAPEILPRDAPVADEILQEPAPPESSVAMAETPEITLEEGTETIEQVLDSGGEFTPLPEPEPEPAKVATPGPALETSDAPDPEPTEPPESIPEPEPAPFQEMALNTVDDLDASPRGPVPPQPAPTISVVESAPLDEGRIEQQAEWDIVLASQVALKRDKPVITDPNAVPEVSSVAKPAIDEQSLEAPEPEVEPISENVLVASREITPIAALPYERPVRKSVQRREAAKPLAEMPTESWLIDLGSFRSPRSASRAWSTLVNRHRRDLDGLVEVLEQKGSSSLLSAGPVSSRAEADRLCNVMRHSAPDCAPRLAWAASEQADATETNLPPPGTAESWLIDLGEYGSQGAATAAWRRLRAGDSRLTDMVYFLEQAGSGSRLMAGPVSDWNLVDSLCDSLRQMTHACTPRPAWQGP